MDYLTAKEVSELKGCSERYIQRLIKNGKMVSEQTNNIYNNQPCYMIPISALSEDLQAKYYRQKRTESGVLPEKTDFESNE
ncbi:MAG: integrase, partial [Ruminococcus sp.]|nr:integrase [Ruminococcus sp.]